MGIKAIGKSSDAYYEQVPAEAWGGQGVPSPNPDASREHRQTVAAAKARSAAAAAVPHATDVATTYRTDTETNPWSDLVQGQAHRLKMPD